MKIWYVLMIMAAATFCGCCGPAVQMSEPASPIDGLAQRVAPSLANQIDFEELASPNGKDLFELEQIDGRIVIRGNNAIAQAVGLNWYLKYYCNSSVSWYAADPISLPDTLPAVEGKIQQECAVDNRFFLNYCTFGYTMPWWQWNDWERLIDWMALNGVTMPLAITGQEAIWQKVWMDFGLRRLALII